MKVDYTIPGFGPGSNIEVTPPTVSSPSFKSRLRRLSSAMPKSWRQLLRVNQPPLSAMSIDGPSRPHVFDVTDAADHRQRWRNLLDRHTDVLAADTAAGDPDWHVQRMMALLMQYRDMEDVVSARHLSETGD